MTGVGGFVGSSFSEPLLNAGMLLSIFAYMLFTQPWMALVALLIFCPQMLFIPLLQGAINRRTKRRIETMRALSVDIVDEAAERGGVRTHETFRQRVAKHTERATAGSEASRRRTFRSVQSQDLEDRQR